MEAFLDLNGYALVAADRDCIATFEGLAAGQIDEADLAAWIRTRIARAG
jgi:prophage maintenance system killer protein